MIPYSIHSMTLESPTHSLVYDSFWTHDREASAGSEERSLHCGTPAAMENSNTFSSRLGEWLILFIAIVRMNNVTDPVTLLQSP